MHTISRFAVATAVIAACVHAHADAPAQREDQSVYRSGVDLVTLHVTVTDRRQGYLSDLDEAEFRVFEDGRLQHLRFFQRSGLPLALLVLLDTSASMQSALPIVKRAASAFVHQLKTGDIASVVAFDDSVRVLQEFTSDRAALDAAIQLARPGDTTSLYTAVYVALKELEKTAADPDTHTPRRRTLVVLSDGDDSSSVMRFEDLLDAATRTDTTIYPIELGRRPAPFRYRGTTQFVLRRLAEHTGGRAFFPETQYQLPAIYKSIRQELSSQFALAYESTDRQKDGRFRQLSVLVQRPGAVARTKRGYFAPRR